MLFAASAACCASSRASTYVTGWRVHVERGTVRACGAEISVSAPPPHPQPHHQHHHCHHRLTCIAEVDPDLRRCRAKGVCCGCLGNNAHIHRGLRFFAPPARPLLPPSTPPPLMLTSFFFFEGGVGLIVIPNKTPGCSGNMLLSTSYPDIFFGLCYVERGGGVRDESQEGRWEGGASFLSCL